MASTDPIYYRLWNGFTGLFTGDAPAIDYEKKSTAFSPALDNSWKYWKSHFTIKIGNARYVIDPSQNNQIVSEGMAFGLLMAIQQNDKQLFDELLSGISKMEGNGLPAWRAYIEGEKIVIRSDADRVSASDADQDITYALVQANSIWGKQEYRIKAQQYLDRLWDGDVQYDGHSAVLKPSEDWGGATGSTGTAFNGSYVSAFMYEAFEEFDSNASHHWKKLMENSISLREAVIAAKQLRGQNTPKQAYSEIPDWVAIAWPTTSESAEIYTHPTRRSTMGLDAIRTLWRIALDASELKDVSARDKCIKLARKMIDAVQDKDIPKDIVLVDPHTGAKVTNTEIALAAYAALAYAATLPLSKDIPESAQAQYAVRCKELTDKLLKISKPGGTFNIGSDAAVDNKYYEQTSSWIAARIIGNGFGRFAATIFSDSENAPGKQGQALRALHRSGHLVHTEYIPLLGGHGAFVDSSERAELDLMKRLVWLYDEGNILQNIGIRTASSERTMGYRLLAAEEAAGLTFNMEAIKQYQLILESSPASSDSDTCQKATEEIFGVIEAAKLSANFAVELFRGILKKNPNNPFVQLGLAQALASTYNHENYPEALVILDKVKAAGDGSRIAVSKAFSLRATIFLRLAEFSRATRESQRAESLLFGAIENVNSAISTCKDARLQLAFKYQKAEILFKAFALTGNDSKLQEAKRTYALVLSDKNIASIPDLQTKAFLGYSSILRTEDAPESLDEALKMISKQLFLKVSKIKKAYEDPEVIQLSAEKIRILRAQKANPSSELMATLAKLPSGRLRTSFERIVYFLDRGEIEKARKDAEQFASLLDALSAPQYIASKLLDNPTISSLKEIEREIRYKILPEISENPGKLNELKAPLTAKIQALPNSFKYNQEYLALVQNNELESLAENIERLEELNSLLVIFKKKGGTFKQHLQALMPALKIMTILKDATKPSNILLARKEAVEAAGQCENLLKEKPLDGKYFGALRELFEEGVRVLADNGARAQAIGLLLEFVGEGYVPNSRPGTLQDGMLGALRNKEIRGGILPAGAKGKFFEVLADMYSYERNTQQATKYYRLSLDLPPQSTNIEKETQELKALYKDNPFVFGIISKLVSIKYDNLTASTVLKRIRGEE